MPFQSERRESAPSWALSKGKAMTFTPRSAGVLRVHSGRAWVTTGRIPHRCRNPQALVQCDDDMFIDSQTTLSLRAGQSVVVESWPAQAGEPLCLQWEAAAASAGAQRWQQTVVQPGRELGQALAQTSLALVKLLQGLLAYTAPASMRRGRFM